ncbi:penicillin-binding protein 2 [Candidatus Peregrinibacteria bacterium]|nr:penicillin-binding protein 2 [Candidatus Peregrinibacteria bacterium]
MVRKKWRNRWRTSASSGSILFPNRIRILTAVVILVFGIIFVRLFQLQVVNGSYYQKKIQSQVSSEIEFSARRGNILVRDSKTGNLLKLALNTSLDELRVDAEETPDKHLVVELLTPIIFREEEYAACQKDPTLCPEESVIYPEPKIDEKSQELLHEDPLLPTFEEALQKKKAEIFRKINTENRYVLIKRQLSPEESKKIRDLKDKYTLEHKRDRARLFAEKKSTATAIPDYFKGIILEPKNLRYYPENELASQVLGFVNHDGTGQYGVEEKLNGILSGQKGVYTGRTDTIGRSIGLSVEDFQKAIDGSDVVLTLDRIIQKKVEDVLAERVHAYKADSGQVIVMNPKNGYILAMANYPTFNPNEFGNVYLTRRITPDDFNSIGKSIPLLKKNPEDPSEELIPATFDEYEEAWKLEYNPEFYIYENFAGPRSYLNKTVQEIYEPGSVFKPVVMSIGLDTGEVRPSSTYIENGPIQVDVGGELVPIKNGDGKYLGVQTMIQVLERSANLGMAAVAKKLGKGVMYEYLNEFGFGKETFVELAQEIPGKLNHYTKWSTAALLNTAFGQGISTTPLQVITAWSTLANGGLLPEPHIVSEIQHPDGSTQKTEPKYKSVLKADTAATLTSMLVSSVENGVARKGGVPGYKVAGKTGTSQIAGADGNYEDTSHDGSTITSFAGYAPADDPKFVILVKFDRPRIGPSTWGENTAAPTFKLIAEFLLDYYEVAPEK